MNETLELLSLLPELCLLSVAAQKSDINRSTIFHFIKFTYRIFNFHHTDDWVEGFPVRRCFFSLLSSSSTFTAFAEKKRKLSRIACDFCLFFCILKKSLFDCCCAAMIAVVSRSVDRVNGKWHTHEHAIDINRRKRWKSSRSKQKMDRAPAREQLLKLTTRLSSNVRVSSENDCLSQDYTPTRSKKNGSFWLRDFKDVCRLHNLKGTTN